MAKDIRKIAGDKLQKIVPGSNHFLQKPFYQAKNQLPWGHNITLMYEISDKKEREFYIQKAKEHGWSRNVLSMQIETNLYNREGKAKSIIENLFHFAEK